MTTPLIFRRAVWPMTRLIPYAQMLALLPAMPLIALAHVLTSDGGGNRLPKHRRR